MISSFLALSLLSLVTTTIARNSLIASVANCPAPTATSVLPIAHITGALADSGFSNCCAVQDSNCGNYVDSSAQEVVCAQPGLLKWYCNPTTTAPPTTAQAVAPVATPAATCVQSGVFSGTACSPVKRYTDCRGTTTLSTICPAGTLTAYGSTTTTESGCTKLATGTCNINSANAYVGMATFSSSVFLEASLSSTIPLGPLKTTIPITDETTTNFARANDAALAGGIAVMHRGYFVPTCSGIWRIAISSADDIFMAWFGSTAYTGWTTTNYNLYSALNPKYTQRLTVDVNVVAGHHYPIRWLWINAGAGGAYYQMTVSYYPTGNTSATGTAISFTSLFTTCDPGHGAPPFPNYGTENNTANGVVPTDYENPVVFV